MVDESKRCEDSQSFIVAEPYPRRSDSVALVIGQNLDATATLYAMDVVSQFQLEYPTNE